MMQTTYMKWSSLTLWVLVLLLACCHAHAAIDVYEFQNEAQEAQYRGLIDEFRCPKCQNQNLASSDAPIAQDLKQKTYDLVVDGKTDAEIRDYMVTRYGDFISYKPPIKGSTLLLWLLPPLLLLCALGFWFVVRRRADTVASAMPASTTSLSEAEQARLDKLLDADTPSGSGERETHEMKG